MLQAFIGDNHPVSERTLPSGQPKAEVLVVDDDLALGKLITEFFKEEPFKITIAITGEEALAQIAVRDFSLVILDVMLPGMDGFSVLRRMRRETDIPVLMLTTRGSSIDRVNGLELGADDYLPKPFMPQELQARVRSILRRAHPRSGRMSYVRIDDLDLDERGRRVRRSGCEVDLTGAEFKLLQLLLSKPGFVCSREDLVSIVFQRSTSTVDRSIDSLVSNLRKKLGPAAGGGDRIRSVRGIGYAYAAEDSKLVKS